MKHRFRLFQRAGVFYCEDTTTGKQTSLRTRTCILGVTLARDLIESP